MAISVVGTTTATTASGSSVTCTKHASTTTGDLLLAFFTSNNQNCTPPAGWTEIADETIEVFRSQVFYKIAGGSEPADYAFTVSSSTILVVTVVSLRGIDTADGIDIDPVIDSGTSHSEPYTTPTVTGGGEGRLLYFRQARRTSSTPITYTASGVTELSDVGVGSGSTSYSHALYIATADYSTGGSKSGLAITANNSETHNVVLTLAAKKDPGVVGTVFISMPSIPSVSMAGSWAIPAVLNGVMPLPTMDVAIYNGTYNGPLDVQVPITVSIAGNTPVRGTINTVVMPIVEFLGETRFFGGNSVTPEREERWFVMTQDGYYLGVRTGVDLPMRVQIPLPVVAFNLQTATFASQVAATGEANNASVSTVFSAGTGVAAGGASGPIITDNFNRADNASTMGTATTGQAWTNNNGNWGITSNKAYSLSVNSIATVDTGATDGQIQATLATAGGGACIVFRLADTSHFFQLEAQGAGDKYDLWVNNAGYTNLGTGSVNCANGQIVTILYNGSSLDWYVDGILDGSATYAGGPAGTKVGFRHSGGATPNFDDFSVAGLTILYGNKAFADEPDQVTWGLTNDASVKITFDAEPTPSVTATAYNLIGASVQVPSNAATGAAYGASAGQSKNAPAGNAAASGVGNPIITTICRANAGAATATAAGNTPLPKLTSNPGNALASCHN